MVTDVSSRYIYSYCKSFIYYANANPYSEHIGYKKLKNSNNIYNIKKYKIKKNNKIYIFTNGYAGYSLRFSLITNINLINKTIKIAKKYNVQQNIIIKLHPSESIDLYQKLFPKIKIIKEPIENIINQVNRAIITSSTVLFLFSKDVLKSYYPFSDRPYSYPSNEINSIESIVKSSLEIE